MLPLRAVENRTAIARAANTGVSALVEPTGRVSQILPLSQAGVLEGAIATGQHPTVYTRLGDWFPYTCLALSLGLIAFNARAIFAGPGARMTRAG